MAGLHRSPLTCLWFQDLVATFGSVEDSFSPLIIQALSLITTYFSIFYFFLKKLSFLISTNQTCFWFKKYKKIVFSLYSQKQVFENKKQKLLPNITLVFPRVYLVGGMEKWEGKKLFYLVEKKSWRIENVVYVN